MRTQKLTQLLTLAVTIALMTAFAAKAPAGQQMSGGANEEVLQLFEKGISFFEQEKYAEARQTFDKILSMRPDTKTALQMRQEADIGLFARMQSKEELAPVANRFIELMNDALREKRRSVGNIQETLLNFQSEDTATFGQALNRIIGHGPYAVPYLLKFLTLQGERTQKIVDRTFMAIEDMGRDAALPLSAALNTENSLLKMRVINLLKKTGDWRAVPALLSIANGDESGESMKKAAAAALNSITGKRPTELPSTADAYARLAEAYLHEKHDMVGYLDLATGDLWQWNPDAEKLKNRLVYRTYPNYLYFLRKGTNVALEGLRLNPDDTRLQTLLLTLQTVQMTRCRIFASEEYISRLGGESLGENTMQVASELLGQFKKSWPKLAHLYSPELVGRALEETMKMGDSMSAYSLLELLVNKPALCAKNGGDSLLKALDYTDKEIRYTAAIGAVKQSPTGSLGQPDKIVRVLSAALHQATAKTALLVFNDFNARNAVATALRKKGVTTVGSRANPVDVNNSLNLQPAVDAVFLTANISDSDFKRIRDSLEADVRTKGVPIYAMVNSRKEAVKISQGIDDRIKLGQLKSPEFKSLVKQKLLRQSNTPLTDKKEKTVLRAIQALLELPAEATKYELTALEPDLVRALRGYSEDVQMGSLRVLEQIGSADALGPVSKKVSQEEASPELKAQACHTLAAVTRRTNARPSEKIVKRLKEGLTQEDADVQRAAAEALGAAGLSAEDILELKAEYSRLEPVSQ